MVGGEAQRAGARWRVFVSHTSELREFPRGRSYVAAVERAVAACGHVVVDMADFPAADLPPARLCTDRVESCDVYLGVLGTRYGSPVRDRPEVSYTELEFEAATAARLHRLVFMLDTEADGTGIPPSGLIDLEFGARQEAFRRRVQTGLGTRSFADPGTLGQLVERSLRELAGKHAAAGGAVLPVRLAPRPEFLAGRERLLGHLDALLAGGPGHAGPRTAVLCGLGGAGKTSVAVEYAHRHVSEVAVCWQFAAHDPAVLAAEFAVLAAQFGVRDAGDPVASVHGVLARQEAGWLVVFDNARDRASIEPFLPPAGPGRVLITTQNQHWRPGKALDVPALDAQVAAEFLLTRTGDPDEATARELAAELGGLPLALEQAAAYMEATGTLLVGYLRLFRARQADLLARGEAAGHPSGVAATLGLALSRLATEVTATGLLRLLAFLSPEPVPLTLLFAGGRDIGLPGPAWEAVVPLLGDLVAMGDAVAALRRYSLVTPAGPGQVLVHRLVQVMARAQLAGEASAHWDQAAAALVEAAIPDDTSLPAAWPACAALLPHARAVLPPSSDGMARIANYLGASGSYTAARDLFQLITDAHAAHDALGPGHPGTLDAHHQLAHWTGKAGDAAAARDQYAALLPVCGRILGPEDPTSLAARYGLARWTGEAGDAAGARDQFAALLPVRERVLGREHPDTLKVRHSLAYWIGEAGDAAGARDQFAALLPVRERVLGPEHRDNLTTHGNLARYTGKAGDAAAACEQYAALLPVRERVLGSEHPDSLAARQSLAFWTGEAGDAAAARDQFAALLPVRERVLGSEHPDTLTTRADLAYATGEAGDAAAARDQFAALLPVRERVLGAEHPDTLAARYNLARWSGVAGDAAGARDRFAALLPSYRRIRGSGHPDTLSAQYSLAHWTGEAGDADEAHNQLASLLPVNERVDGAGHPRTLMTRRELARWASRSGDDAASRHAP